MIEVYLFFAMFLVQILVMSVWYPARMTRRGEWPPELYPGVDANQAHEHFARYRVANKAVALLGLLLLGWFIIYMQRPHWEKGIVGGIVTAYFLLQHLPIILIAWITARFKKVHRSLSREPKRKAILQRRGLFDFVSPLTVFLAIVAYFQFAAFMFYVARHPFSGFGGPFANIGIVSLGYILLGGLVTYVLYSRKKDPLQTHSDRMRIMSFAVNCYAWTCILVPIFGSLSVARQMLDLETWGPFSGTVFFLILTLLHLRTGHLTGPARSAGWRNG